MSIKKLSEIDPKKFQKLSQELLELLKTSKGNAKNLAYSMIMISDVVNTLYDLKHDTSGWETGSSFMDKAKQDEEVAAHHGQEIINRWYEHYTTQRDVTEDEKDKEDDGRPYLPYPGGSFVSASGTDEFDIELATRIELLEADMKFQGEVMDKILDMLGELNKSVSELEKEVKDNPFKVSSIGIGPGSTGSAQPFLNLIGPTLKDFKDWDTTTEVPY